MLKIIFLKDPRWRTKWLLLWKVNKLSKSCLHAEAWSFMCNYLEIHGAPNEPPHAPLPPPPHELTCYDSNENCFEIMFYFYVDILLWINRSFLKALLLWVLYKVTSMTTWTANLNPRRSVVTLFWTRLETQTKRREGKLWLMEWKFSNLHSLIRTKDMSSFTLVSAFKRKNNLNCKKDCIYNFCMN